MLYFAYGSNMDWNEMRACCPSAQFVCLGKLNDYRLAFTRRSQTRGCGVADIVKNRNDVVWGVIYDIAEGDLPNLDSKEGYRVGRRSNAYEPIEVTVQADGRQDRLLRARAYLVCRQEHPNPNPNAAYKRLLVAGARHWRLPADYVAQLEQIGVAE